MKRIHIAIATQDILGSVNDYSARLGFPPSVVVDGQYALWRSEQINLSVRHDLTCKPGELRHLGWEDPAADEFTTSTDINGIVWERFTAAQQAEEIIDLWPECGYES